MDTGKSSLKLINPCRRPTIFLQAIYEWTSQKRIPHIKLGRLVKLDIIEADRWLLSQRIEPDG